MNWLPVYDKARDGTSYRNDYAIRSECGAYRVAEVHVCGDIWYEPRYRGQMLGEPTHDAQEAKERCAAHAVGRDVAEESATHRAREG
jgi:hypothetical protein